MSPSEALTDRERRILQDYRVIDADVHVHESPEALAPYCAMPWRKALENLIGVPERYLDIPGFSPGTGYEPKFPGSTKMRMVLTAEQMREELEQIGIETGILFPDHLLKIAVLPNPEWATAVGLAYNEWLMDKWVNRDKHLKAAILAIPQNPEASAREIERWGKEPGVCCVYLPAAGVSPLWGHRMYDPIYQAAQDADLPVVLHSVEMIHPVFPFNLNCFESGLARHAIAHSMAMAANMISMIETALPVRFPKLDVCFMEGGFAWVPFVMQRLDKEYLERRRDLPLLTDRPSRYIKKWYIGTQPISEPEEPWELEATIKLYGGEDTTVFASDWPHHDFDHPRELLRAQMSEELKRKIFHDNAARLFRLDRR